jgi:uncharacterized RDD family membrane protein YckC
MEQYRTLEEELAAQEASGRELAGMGRRFVAILIDAIILGVIGFFVGMFGGRGVLNGPYGERMFDLLLAFLYFSYFDSKERSGTGGKQAMGIMVVDESDQRLEFPQSALRTIVKVLTGLLPLLWLIPLFTSRRQGIHDFAAKTYVVKS